MGEHGSGGAALALSALSFDQLSRLAQHGDVPALGGATVGRHQGKRLIIGAAQLRKLLARQLADPITQNLAASKNLMGIAHLGIPILNSHQIISQVPLGRPR